MNWVDDDKSGRAKVGKPQQLPMSGFLPINNVLNGNNSRFCYALAASLRWNVPRCLRQSFQEASVINSSSYISAGGGGWGGLGVSFLFQKGV